MLYMLFFCFCCYCKYTHSFQNGKPQREKKSPPETGGPMEERPSRIDLFLRRRNISTLVSLLGHNN